MDVPDSFVIADVNVDLGILHTWQGDLVVIIEHNATSVTIVDQPGVPALGSFGCDQDNYAGAIIDDEGSGGPIEDICQPDLSSPPNYTPNNPLSAFDGMDAAGTWTITVNDMAGFDTGSLEQWSLHFGTPGPSPCIPSGASVRRRRPARCKRRRIALRRAASILATVQAARRADR